MNYIDVKTTYCFCKFTNDSCHEILNYTVDLKNRYMVLILEIFLLYVVWQNLSNKWYPVENKYDVDFCG